MKLDDIAIVLERHEDVRAGNIEGGVVLWWRDDPFAPFVVHRFDAEGSLFSGGYHQDLRLALADFDWAVSGGIRVSGGTV